MFRSIFHRIVNERRSVLGTLRPSSSPFSLLRIGGDHDGGYLVPDDLSDIQSCVSPGVGETFTFEDSMSSFGIKSVSIDKSASPELADKIANSGHSFLPLWLDILNTSDSISLQSVCHSLPQGDKILQMDIEGAEFRIISQAPSSILSQFRIIILEIHEFRVLQEHFLKLYAMSVFAGLWVKLYPLLKRLAFSSFLSRCLRATSRIIEPYLMLRIIKKLVRTHTVIHVHPNNCCGSFVEPFTSMNFGYGMEFIFLRKDRFVGSDILIEPMLPHPLDRDNVAENPPLHLNNYWFKSF